MSQEVIEITEREIEVIEVVEKGPLGPVGPVGPQANINYTVVTANQTLTNSQNIAADTSGGSFTLTLPASPNAGDSIDIFDYANTFDTNPLTIAHNGKNIESMGEDLTANVEGAYFTLIYTEEPRGWQILPRYGVSGIEDVLSAEGDLLYRGASSETRLPIGTAGQVLKVNSGATAPEWGSISGSISVTGSDLTLSGATGTAITNATIANDAVTNAKLANMAQSTIKGRATASTGDPEDLSASQVRTILNVADGAEVNVNADWDAVSGDAQILNKPTLGTAAAAATTDFAAAVHTHDAADVTTGTFDNARINFAAPPAIGNTTPAAGSFTTLTANTSLTLNGTGAAELINAGAAAGPLQIYNTFTSATNHERGFLRWSSNVFQIGTEKGSGGGTARALEFQTDGIARIRIGTGPTGIISFLDSNPSVVGNANGRIYILSSGVGAPSGSSSYISGGSSGQAVFRIGTSNSDSLNVSGGNTPTVQFGGTTSSFPALKRDSTSLQVKLADDSAFTAIQASNLTLTDNTGGETATFDAQNKLSANRTYDLPNASGTLALTSDTTKNLWIPASAWIPKTTAGCGVDSRETTTNDQNFDELLFDTGSDEFADALVVMPSNYNNGTITARFYWTAASGSGGVAWAIQGRAFANDDALDTAAGTAQLVTDTLIAADDMHVTSATSAVTIGGTPAANTPIQFTIYRDVSDAGDDLAVDARLLGVEIIFN